MRHCTLEFAFNNNAFFSFRLCLRWISAAEESTKALELISDFLIREERRGPRRRFAFKLEIEPSIPGVRTGGSRLCHLFGCSRCCNSLLLLLLLLQLSSFGFLFLGGLLLCSCLRGRPLGIRSLHRGRLLVLPWRWRRRRWRWPRWGLVLLGCGRWHRRLLHRWRWLARRLLLRGFVGLWWNSCCSGRTRWSWMTWRRTEGTMHW
mmetsp:Transcript_47888/g.87739  ORF Transcript_47888/g.87739 Transcript_47888/m.87739 type:complete len:205 (+) Transcript_47888:271-885(+)